MRHLVFLATVASLCIFSSSWAYDFSGAAKRYRVPVELLEAISKVESGHNSLAVNRNRNGSIDLGHMQVNSEWQKSGKIDWSKLTDPDYCSNVGAWILAQEMRRYNGNIWAAVAAYNTGKSARDWEKIAGDSEGKKRETALSMAAKGRAYSHSVYAAMQRIGKRKGADKSLKGLDENAPRGKDSKIAAMAVQNPFGTLY